MTTPLECLHDLHTAGVRLTVSDNNLIAKPSSRVTPQMVNRIRDLKPRLLAILEGRQTPCCYCGARVVHDQTFDGYLNRLCTGCGRWFTCLKSNQITH